jgi:CRP-like cAMP-binding protein
LRTAEGADVSAYTLPPRNQILDRLPATEYQRLLPLLQPVPLKLRQVLYEVRSPIDAVYFPTAGVVSAVTVMADGGEIEVGTIGFEGVVGSMAFIGPATSPNRVYVQVAGDALRMDAAALRTEAGRDGPLSRLLALYNTAFLAQVTQSVACNGLHAVHQRCCRWLLITLDRVASPVLPLTHEFLAIMLGVRRSSVSDVLNPLQEQGLIRYSRGKITVLDRHGLEAESCECYRRVHDEFERLFG